MPQLVPFFFVNQVTYNFLLLIVIIYMFSKYILPRIVRLFKTRIFLKNLEG
jgi:F-type H+-transporting ATPase subunit 8